MMGEGLEQCLFSPSLLGVQGSFQGILTALTEEFEQAVEQCADRSGRPLHNREQPPSVSHIIALPRLCLCLSPCPYCLQSLSDCPAPPCTVLSAVWQVPPPSSPSTLLRHAPSLFSLFLAGASHPVVLQKVTGIFFFNVKIVEATNHTQKDTETKNQLERG